MRSVMNAEVPPELPAVDLRGVCARYESPGAVIHGVNMRIAQGEFFAFIGPNGGGKTTLIKVILGLVKPYAGEAYIYGEPAGRRHELVGYVPQFATCRRDFPITVRRMIRLALQNSLAQRTRPGSSEQNLVTAALDRVGLSHVADRRLGELSGGQLQRALIAKALVREPRMLILDEPTASIDPEGETELLRLFEELSRSMTIIMVSHDVHYVLRCVGRVACVNREVVVHEANALEGVDTQLLYGGMLKAVMHNHTISASTSRSDATSCHSCATDSPDGSL